MDAEDTERLINVFLTLNCLKPTIVKQERRSMNRANAAKRSYMSEEINLSLLKRQYVVESFKRSQRPKTKLYKFRTS